MKFKVVLSVLCIIGALLFASREARAAEPVTEQSSAGYNPLGPVRLGVLAGAGLPSLISAQALFKYKEIVGANLELGMLPELTFPGGNVKVRQEMIDFSLRLYPFKGAFFFGCGIGAQRLVGTAQASAEGITGETSVRANTVFVSPRLGFVHRFSFGLAIGMDLGLEVPISGSVDTSSSVAGATVPKDASNVADFAKKVPIPILHILQLGYIF